jgi:hypothetical protein
MPNQPTPIGFSRALPMCFHESVHVPGAKCWLVATGMSFCCNAAQPPTSLSARNTSGAKPSTIMKNWSTSL